MLQVRSMFVSMAMLIPLWAGCGTKPEVNPNLLPVFPVTGQVKYQGRPVEGAMVRFLTLDGKTGASGTTDKEGKYSLTTYAGNDGAVAGKHFVAITKTEGGVVDQGSGDIDSGNYVPPAENARPSPVKELLPRKYALHTTTNPLKAEVSESGANTIDFELKD